MDERLKRFQTELLKNQKLYQTRQGELLRSLDFVNDRLQTFTPQYNTKSPACFSCDGSYISYIFISSIRLELIQIRVCGLEMEYEWHGTLPNSKIVAQEVTTCDLPLVLDHSVIGNEPSAHFMQWIMAKIEQKILLDFARETREKLIIIDGSIFQKDLEQKLDEMPWNRWIELNEELGEVLQVSMNDLIDVCHRNKHQLIGLSKDSHLEYFENPLNLHPYNISFEDMCQKTIRLHRREDQCLYYILDKDQLNNVIGRSIRTASNRNRLESDQVGICYARLHKNAYKFHRIDYLKTDWPIERILKEVAKYSIQHTLPGTPIVQENCHNLAVRIRKTKPFVEKEIRQMLLNLGYSNDIYNDIFTTDAEGQVAELTRRRSHEFSDCFYT